MNKSERLIVALDYPTTIKQISNLIEAGVSWFKIRPRFFQYHQAWETFVFALKDTNLMYDGKLQDTPDSVHGDVKHAFELGFKYVTVMAEINGVGAAIYAPRAEDQHVLVVGNLTSQPLAANHVEAYLAGFDRDDAIKVGGAVVPGCDLKHLRHKYPKAILVTPGIRMVGERPDDHEAEFGTMHPSNAIKAGATQIVVGRPITLAVDLVAAAKRYLQAVSSV